MAHSWDWLSRPGHDLLEKPTARCGVLARFLSGGHARRIPERLAARADKMHGQDKMTR